MEHDLHLGTASMSQPDELDASRPRPRPFAPFPSLVAAIAGDLIARASPSVPVNRCRRAASIAPATPSMVRAARAALLAMSDLPVVSCPLRAAAIRAASAMGGSGQRAVRARPSRLLRTSFQRRRASRSRRPGARRCMRWSACSAASRDGPSDQSEGDPDRSASPSAKSLAGWRRSRQGGRQ